MCPDFSQPPKEDKTKIQKRTSCLGFYFIFLLCIVLVSEEKEG